jgi:NADPH-dependent ferric siderophore reductase
MKTYTPIQDPDRKLDIMDHVNQDHSKELLMIAQTYAQNDLISEAMIQDIYEEGVELKVHEHETNLDKTVFVEFELRGDLEEQILYLAYNSFVKNKVEFSHNARQYFEVISKSQLTKNMVRLLVKSKRPFPNNYAGYAYGFILKVLEKTPKNINTTSNKSGFLKNMFDRGFLWLMKHLSSKKRQQMLYSMNKDIRLYTLRQAFSLNNDSQDLHYGYIDIFTHGESAGSKWVEQLSTGSLISSRTETDDKHEHLDHGHSVLIADETAYPALAGILDFWKNPIPPTVILISKDEDDFKYFEEFKFPENTKVKYIVGTHETYASEVLQFINDLSVVEAVWGAMENNTAKKIRHYLRNERKVIGKNNHIKGYWRMTEES